jgi:hypothetical protein
MSDEFDAINKLAKLQDKPPRTARDLAVLEAAKSKAAITRQTLSQPAKKPEPFWSFLSKPIWLGTGSLAAALLSVFIVFGQQEPPQQKTAEIGSAPIAAAPEVAPAVAPAVTPKPALTPKKQTPVASPAPVAIAKQSESRAALEKREGSADVASVEQPKLAAPSALAMPAPAAARKRDSASNLNASDACISEIKTIPFERQNLAVETTRLLLERCEKSLANMSLPTDLEWAKKLIESQPEKFRLKPVENK